MRDLKLAGLALVIALPLQAEEQRQLDAHQHGLGQVNIAFEGALLAIELTAPGADIVGFEHVAKSAEDRAAVAEAIALLAQPLSLFVLPDDAACSVTEARAELVGDDHGHDHDHDKDAHSEFRAEYALTCANPSALARISFAYFDAFPNAVALQGQMIWEGGSDGFEVDRDAPVLDLAGRI